MYHTELVDAEEAAELLGTTERHVRRLRAERRLPYVKVGHKLRFAVKDLEAFIAANTVDPVDAVRGW